MKHIVIFPVIVLFLLLGLVLPGSPANAERISLDGNFVYVVFNEVLSAPEAPVATVRIDQRGFNVQKDPSHLLHLASQDCTGHLEGNAETFEGGGSCVVVPNDGSGRLWVSWTGTQDGGTWTVSRGSGRFAGATGNGRYTLLPVNWSVAKGGSVSTGVIEIP